jgi:hypothetical protein
MGFTTDDLAEGGSGRLIDAVIARELAAALKARRERLAGGDRISMRRLSEEDWATTREDLAGPAPAALLSWSYGYVPRISRQSP